MTDPAATPDKTPDDRALDALEAWFAIGLHRKHPNDVEGFPSPDLIRDENLREVVRAAGSKTPWSCINAALGLNHYTTTYQETQRALEDLIGRLRAAKVPAPAARLAFSPAQRLALDIALAVLPSFAADNLRAQFDLRPLYDKTGEALGLLSAYTTSFRTPPYVLLRALEGIDGAILDEPTAALVRAARGGFQPFLAALKTDEDHLRHDLGGFVAERVAALSVPTAKEAT